MNPTGSMSVEEMDLWNQSRRKDRSRVKSSTPDATLVPRPSDYRTPFERDHDRILFSTPVRRLADKTQVFPLERHDAIRTRLTHSYEVANLARSIGTTLAHDSVFSDCPEATRNIPAILAAAGLAHDLGNPPFGHQGEAAIRSWFKRNKERVFDKGCGVGEHLQADFLKFEGNAQTLRLVTRLQIINDDFGLNLTYATLAALMKYTVPAHEAKGKDAAVAATKKPGFFQSEAHIVKEIWEATGLSSGKRHPLTYVMEACDDIAYSVLDAEDAAKKSLVSFSDVIAFLEPFKGDRLVKEVCEAACADYSDYRTEELSPAELNDISFQKFRVYAIGYMVNAVIEACRTNRKRILSGEFEQDLIAVSESALLYSELKKFSIANAFRHREVLAVELRGHELISDLMDMLWFAIQTRDKDEDPFSSRSEPFANYAFNRISENYRRVLRKECERGEYPLRYLELQLLTDEISGMTDSFAVSLHHELKPHFRQ